MWGSTLGAHLSKVSQNLWGFQKNNHRESRTLGKFFPSPFSSGAGRTVLSYPQTCKNSLENMKCLEGKNRMWRPAKSPGGSSGLRWVRTLAYLLLPKQGLDLLVYRLAWFFRTIDFQNLPHHFFLLCNLWHVTFRALTSSP